MALAKLALRVNGRFLLAAMGLAAAILVPLAGVLATAGLQPQVGSGKATVLIAGEEGLTARQVERATWVLSGKDDPSGAHVVAYTKGDPRLAPGQAFDGGPAGRTIHVANRTLTTVASAAGATSVGVVLVHPSVLGPAQREAAGFASGGPTAALPGRGSDAYEVAGIRGLKAYTGALTVVSLPVVILVAASFARLEARSLSTAVAVVAALGRPERAGQILTARALLLAACGGALALGATLGAVKLGVLPADSEALASRSVAFGVAVPAFAAAVAGSAIAWTTMLRARAQLRERPALGGEPRLGWLPVRLRPLITGWKLVGVLFLVGAVVALDVGLPLAASGVPAALAGGRGEWVIGVESASITSGRTAQAPAEVMAEDPAIDEIAAEVFVPTVVRGEPFVFRGGDWPTLRDYHGLRLLEGEAPRPGAAEVALGERGADQAGLDIGDSVIVPVEGNRLARLTVSGMYAASGPLADEGVLPLADAQKLAGLPAGTVHAVRLRPQTADSLAAMHRAAPDVRVLDVRIAPRDPPAGSLAAVAADVVNLSGVPGTRVLNLRVDGVAVATASVTLSGYGRRDVELPFIVPEGAFDVAVNPEATGFGSGSSLEMEAPAGVVTGQELEVRLLHEGKPVPGIAVGLFAGGPDALEAPPESSAETDAQGRASLRVEGTGAKVLATREGPEAAREVYAIAQEDADIARIVVEAAYTQPANPTPGSTAAVAARVRNVGGVEGAQRINFTIDGEDRGYGDVVLAPGEATTVSLSYAPRRSGESIQVGGVAVARATATRASGPTVEAGPAAPGEALQVRVADRLLGNARSVLGGLAITACVSAVAVLVLSAKYTLASRGGITAVLATVWKAGDIQRRAAVEAAVLGAAGGMGGVLAAKAFIAVLAQWTTVRVFGHALGDPFSLLFMLQVGGTTAFLTALTMYNAVGRRLSGGVLRALRSGEALE